MIGKFEKSQFLSNFRLYILGGLSMDQVLYDLMDWAGIEEIVYSEAANPERLLGAHEVEEGLLIQVFMPHAVAVAAKVGSKSYPMELQDEAGYYAVLLHGKKMSKYLLEITYDNGTTEELQDPYAFPSQFTDAELKKFDAGIYYDVYRKMGAHPMTIDGVNGVYFAVWAPCAMRVSVVGDFNMWDGRRHQMKRLGDSGVFELFMPGLKAGTLYKYEIKNHRGEPMLKSDPYGNYSELRPDNASIVWDLEQFTWSDEVWMKNRELEAAKDKPLSIYELHLGSWMRHELKLDEDGEPVTGSEFYNYREIAPKLAEYVKKLGYTHVELMPVMEHPLDESWGYQVTGYYAPTSRYGTPDDFMYFMNYMHEQGIGVILDWVPAHFPRDAHGLACFDGSCVYEHQDPRQGAHPHWGTLIYNYGRPQVTNFLIANALFWAKQYHADGIRMDAISRAIYWQGDPARGFNLNAVEFLQYMNQGLKCMHPSVILAAEDSTSFPKVTDPVDRGGLGFDYKWDMGFMNDTLRFFQTAPVYRPYDYHKLSFSMMYFYSDLFLLPFSHDEVVHGKATIIQKMFGDYEIKFPQAKAFYAYVYMHPGKKLNFMGNEFAQFREWDETREQDWDLLKYPLHDAFQRFYAKLSHLYLEEPALYDGEYNSDCFGWLEVDAADYVTYAWERKASGQTIVTVMNLSDQFWKDFRVALPEQYELTELLNTDWEEFGGNTKPEDQNWSVENKPYKKKEQALCLDLPPFTARIFKVKSVKHAALKKTPKK